MAKKAAVVCDNCKAEALLLEVVDDELETPIGWIHLLSKVTTGFTSDEDYPDEKYAQSTEESGDFCTQACLLEWAQAPARVWNKTTWLFQLL